MRTTLVVCESPWTTEKGFLARWSMRPFVEGIAELYDVRLVYRTFTSGHELRRLLSYEAIDRPEGRVLVYVACHGFGGRLSVGRKGSEIVNLAPLAQTLYGGVEGVWLGACDVGQSRALQDFLKNSGAIWAGGYVCSVDWAASLLLDLAVLQELLRSGPVRTRSRLLRVLKVALKSFDPNWKIGADRHERGVPLRHAIRVLARDKSRGARPKDVSEDLRYALGWQ